MKAKKTQIKLHVYNYGVTEVATFKAIHDALQCCSAFNLGFINTYGKLPEDIFYFITYREHGVTFYNTAYKSDTFEDTRLRSNRMKRLMEEKENFQVIPN